jgi:hypothetical protein
MTGPIGDAAGAPVTGHSAERLTRLAMLATALGLLHHVDHTARANRLASLRPCRPPLGAG